MGCKGCPSQCAKIVDWFASIVLSLSIWSFILLIFAGKAYHIKEVTKGNYFYPKEDGSGDITLNSRPLKEGEIVSLTL